MAEILRNIIKGVKQEFNPTPGITSRPDVLLARALQDYGYFGGALRYRSEVIGRGKMNIPHSHEAEHAMFEDIERRVRKNAGKLPEGLQDQAQAVAAVIAGFALQPYAFNYGDEVSATRAGAVEGVMARVGHEPDSEDSNPNTLLEIADIMRESGLIEERPYKQGTIAYLTTQTDTLLV